MSYGTEGMFASKAAFARHVAETGADSVFIINTSDFITENPRVTVASVADTSAVIVGPNVYTDRKWYANVKRKKDGTVRIV